MTRRNGPVRQAGQATLGVVSIAPALLDQATTDTSPPAWLALGGYTAVVVAALAVRRRWPLAVFCVILGVLAGVEVGSAAEEVRLSSLVVLPPAFALYTVGVHSPQRRSAAALLIGGALVAAGLLINHATAPQGWRGGSDVLAFVAVLPVAWALGMAARGHRALLVAAEQRAEDAGRRQQLLAEQAAAAERVRIARDMHDVVAHSLTLLVVHAETVRARSDELPPWARERVDALAAAGRQATGEMRDLLGVLRDGTLSTAPRSPIPTLAGLPALMETARHSGNPVTFTTTGPVDELPRAVQLAGYRIVQESLSNARRHASGADVAIRLDAGPDHVDLDITSGAPSRPAVPAPGPGLGLSGLAERVAALSGDLRAGPTPDGGFRLRATIPRSPGGPHDATR